MPLARYGIAILLGMLITATLLFTMQYLIAHGRSALTDSLGISVTVNFGRKNGGVPFIDIIANRLSHEVRRNRITSEIVFLKELPFFGNVAFVVKSGLHVEMIAPTGELDAVVAHFFDFGQEIGK